MNQPNQPQYGISELDITPSYANRAAYLAAKGVQAPAFNPALPIKTWEGSGTFTVFDENAPGHLSTIVVPDSAASVNLPGAYDYPTYTAPSTDAQQVGPFGIVGPASADQICTLAEAQALQKELEAVIGSKGSVIELAGMYHYVYPTDQTRKQYYVSFGQFSADAQALIESKYHNGVGAPGHWTWDGREPKWVSDPQVTTAPAGAVTLPVPIRPLLPNEVFAHVQFVISPLQPFVWVVQRTDMQQSQPVESNTPQMSDVMAKLASIEQTLAAIVAKLGA